MKLDNLSNYKNNWIVGDFKPSLFETNTNDIGILYVNKGQIGDSHFHMMHTEFNIILTGSVEINSKQLSIGDIFIYEPFDKSNLIFLEDTILLVIKTPSTKNDKFYDSHIT